MKRHPEIEAKCAELVKATEELSHDNSNKIITGLAVYKLGVHLEQLFKEAAEHKDQEKLVQDVCKEIDYIIHFVKNSSALNIGKDINLQTNDFSREEVENIENYTQNMYGNLWVDFDNDTYFNEAFERLKTRFEKNNVDTNWFAGKTALDDGCGGGRYTVALSKFGFSKVTGIDLSAKGIPDAKNRITGTEAEEKVEFVQGNVLELPFADNSFDFVFSNGVLHHTKDSLQGIKECFRVLKPGGKIWMYMWWEDGIINSYWDVSRAMLKNVEPAVMKNLLILLGLPANRRFYFMDPWFVPIRELFNSESLKKIMEDVGFVNLQHLPRGVHNDTSEMSHQLGEIGRLMYGEGDLRFWAEKPSEE